MKVADFFTQEQDDFYGYCQHCIVIPVPDDARYCADCADAVCEYLLANQQAD
jgi:hypothetical protein